MPGETINVDIEKNLAVYLGDRKRGRRYASFDYCFNYFKSHQEEGRLDDLVKGDALQLSCLHLGFYLASWGMLRGGTELLKRSIRAYVPVVAELVAAPAHLWTLDVDGYNEGTIKEICAFGEQLRRTLHDGATDALVTKILLGTMGAVPAFDRNFTRGFRCSTFGPRALWRISQFYRDHADAIEAGRERTLDFNTGHPTQRLYTQAKVIDMIFFVEGER
jgi:hypothetical protein